MKINRNINNIEELRTEILRLKLLQNEQEAYLSDQIDLLQHKAEAPVRFFNKITSWIPKGSHADNHGGDSKNLHHSSETDWVTNSFRIGLPFLFNKVLFRKAGFIKKTLLLLASQKAAGAVNQDSITNVIDKIASLIRPAKKQKNKKERDYGIPPDSETY